MALKRHMASLLLPLLGYIFVALSAIITAICINSQSLSVLLILSAIVSLILAITRLVSAKKTEERIKYLEKNQLSVSYNAEDETLSLKKGI